MQPATTTEPTTVKDVVKFKLRDASAELAQIAREIEEINEFDNSALIRVIRQLSAASSAAELGFLARPGSTDSDMARELLRNPHRMKNTVIP